MGRGGGGSDHGGDDAAIRKLRREIERLAENPRGAPDYRRVFREFDRDGNGRIDRSEFRKACNDLGIDLSSSELSRVIKKFDRDGDGQVSISEFVKFAEGGGRDGGGHSSRDQDDADDAFDKVRKLVRRAEDDGISLRASFEHFDRDGSGDIDEDELHRGLRKLNIELSRHEAKLVMDKFPGRRSGQVRYADFVKAMRECGRDDDDYGVRKLRKEIERLAD